MENATDALKIAFAAFIFIVALSIVFSLMTKIKATADSILISSDKTTYYNWNTGETNYRQRNGRVVGVDEVISTLKNYRNQATYVRIKKNDRTEEFDYSVGMEAKIEEFIKNNSGSQKIYLENIQEITTGGKYKVAEDGVRVIIAPGVTRTYVIYDEL